MFKRLFWFVLGAVAGVWGYTNLRKQVSVLQEQITPEAMWGQAKKVAQSAWTLGSNKFRDLVNPPSDTAPYDA
jgi:hypothetical protein